MALSPSTPCLRSEAIAALLQHEVKPVLLLGAGASFRSGIPLAGMLVDSIARFAFCKAHNRDPDDPTLMLSDWIRWRDSQPWFRSDAPLADLYPSAVEYLLQPQSNRKEFFQRILRPNVPPSVGYKRLANLLVRRSIRTVLTTNFDDLVVRTAEATPAVPYIEKILTQSDHAIFRTNPSYPQIVYLHGSVHHYTDRNIVNETQELDHALVRLLHPLLRDYPLVVIGYRGAEPSVMKHLLIEQAEICGRFREGIYWCHLPGVSPTQESPLVAELAATIGNNLVFVEIDGFDELMTVLDRSVPVSTVDVWRSPGQATAGQTPHGVPDLEPSGRSLAALNEPLLRTKLIEYADAMRLPKPALDTSGQLWGAMSARYLAGRADGQFRFTKGALLLFAKSSEFQLPQARIMATVRGPEWWLSRVLDQTSSGTRSQEICEESFIISGDLWSQLDQASNLLSRVNHPFRMKGPVSQTTYPYPHLALKELLTNMLAHRSYTDERPAALTVSLREIRFENPGGLVESVRRQLEDESIQQAVGSGGRGLKGYRNPVVADFFFSAGAMDKEGSGLPDVIRESNNNLNTVEFSPTQDNAGFVAVIQCRPEALLVDQETNTAASQQSELRYSPNLLRILAWPERISKLGTIAKSREIGAVEKAGPAPFGSHRYWIWTFASLDDLSVRPLLDLSVDEERHVVPTSELLCHPDAGAVLPRLLNMALSTYLNGLGLRLKYEPGRIRAYYPSDEGKPREISYRSTFRQSKRTVAKPVISRNTGKIAYWEHKAVSLRFERFDSEWALSLLTGYVFTLDGDFQSISSERIGPLSTKRAARDYNPTVFHDLVFWARMLSVGAESSFSMPVGRGEPPLVVTLSSMIPTFTFQESIESGVSDAVETAPSDGELDSLQEEIEQVIAESATEMDEQSEASDH